MAFHACPVCNIQRHVTASNWNQSQITSIERFGTVVVGRYNACRLCCPDGWVDPIMPCGEPHPYACSLCLAIRPHSRRFWTPSQLKSICSLGTSVTPHHNCCRVCDPSCWSSKLGEDGAASSNHTLLTEPMPTAVCESIPYHRDPQGRDDAPLSPRFTPAHIVPWHVSQPTWRPLPPSARPIVSLRPRWLHQDDIQEDIRWIQRVMPQGVWESLVENMTRVELKVLSRSGGCLIPNSPMGREAIIYSDGGADIRGDWFSFHPASLMISNSSTPIFVDVGNRIYKQFITEIWPGSRLWESYTNQVTIGDIVEAALGLFITDWYEAMLLGDPPPHFTDNPIFAQLQRISSICLAGWCDSYMYGTISFVNRATSRPDVT